MQKEDEIFVNELQREVKIQCSKAKGRIEGQYSIQLPKEIVRELNITKGDTIIIKIPLNNKNEYSIRLKRKII